MAQAIRSVLRPLTRKRTVSPYERAHLAPDALSVRIHPDTQHAGAYLHGRQLGYTERGWLRCETTAGSAWNTTLLRLTVSG
ncbi:hypothetical protein AB0N19_39465 [Streptomyces sp. NPDC051132]|uniref:hypothetical protein n=1 Tax=Streptomyces sp. NPDC051132 TaxID=3155667 RepID=UPI00342B5451